MRSFWNDYQEAARGFIEFSEEDIKAYCKEGLMAEAAELFHGVMAKVIRGDQFDPIWQLSKKREIVSG